MNSYRLAVCEDDPAMRAYLKDLCTEILTGLGIPHVISLFSSAGELDAALSAQADSFHLLLLDIQMEGMTGMELAHTLRERGDEVSILFITASPDYALEGHDVHPVHYLLKPVKREALEKALRSDWNSRRAARTVLLRTGGKTLSLPVGDIRYVESRDRTVTIHLPDRAHTLNLYLSDVAALLPSHQFSRCHKSFLVNLAHVERVGRTEVLLQNGEALPVGRRYYEAFQNAFVQYISK